MDPALCHGVCHRLGWQSDGKRRTWATEIHDHRCKTPAVAGIADRAANPLPEGIDLVVTVEKTGSVYNLRGFFLAGSNHIVGTVVAISNDLGLQPAGTSGPFVLYPVSA